MECKRVNKIWFGSALGIKFNNSHSSFIDWLCYCLSTLKEEELCVIASITYGIWFARNKIVFDNHDTEDTDIIDKATTAILDYQNANINHSSSVQINNTITRNNNNSSNINQNQQRNNQHANQS
jgi:hypothetical protein